MSSLRTSVEKEGSGETEGGEIVLVISAFVKGFSLRSRELRLDKTAGQVTERLFF